MKIKDILEIICKEIDKGISPKEYENNIRYMEVTGEIYCKNPLKIHTDDTISPKDIMSKIIKGDFLLQTELEINPENYYIYDLCGHIGYWGIKEYKDIKEVERELLGGAGVLNMFTTEMIVIHKGQVKKYRIYYEDLLGKEYYTYDWEYTEIKGKEFKVEWEIQEEKV